MARYLITGGTGFVGRSLARVLQAAGDEVVLATRGRHQDGDLHNWVEYDLRDRSTIANIIEARPDGVFHLAWSTTPGTAESDSASDVQINLAGTVALFQELSKNMPVPVVFVSSGGTVYGVADTLPITEDQPLRPIGIYGLTKATTEQYAMHFRARTRLDVRIARLSNPFGAHQSAAKLQGAASIFARKIIHREPVTIWGDGSTVRDYVDVNDASDALAAIMRIPFDASETHPIYNIGSGEGLSLRHLLETISLITSIAPNVSYTSQRSFDIPENVLSIGKLNNKTGWKPRSVRQGLEEMMLAMLRSEAQG
ncbi:MULTISPECIES: NAD-dependent epimerase/dehydratase family protein [unclassified Rhizobium]